MAQSATEPESKRVAVFLDRDGVINRLAPDGGYVRDWSEFELLPGALEALAALHDAGAALFIATNQRGVARGLVDAAALEGIHRRLAETMTAAGAPLSGVFVCPHEIGECDCRKPDIGLFRQAQAAHPWIAFDESHLIGDSMNDLLAGHRLGMTLWLVGEDRAAVAGEAVAQKIEVAGSAPSLEALVGDGALLAALSAR
jgi:histidinol-phosphate phosphatase family protein